MKKQQPIYPEFLEDKKGGIIPAVYDFIYIHTGAEPTLDKF